MRGPARRTTRFLVHAFALFGFFDVVGRGILLPFTGNIYGYIVKLPNDLDVEEIHKSADGKLKAILYVWTGSGLNAGCSQMVAIVDARVPVQNAWKHDNLVYRRGCNNAIHMLWEPSVDLRVRPRLRIEADAGKADFMSRSAMNGSVAVAYQGDR